jgi:filamentous hemagglutinin
VNGGGFINTSRATLTTGTPNFAPDGSLAGFNVTRGNITVQGAGFNAGDIDQVAGTIGGNGDLTVNAGTLSNTNGAQLVSGHDLTLDIAQLADNTNATLSGANNVTLNLATGQTQTINAPQSIAGPDGALSISLPSSGM